MSTKEKIKNERIGTVLSNISGQKMKCIDYKNSMNIDVEFLESGYIARNVQWNNFIRGKVKDKKDYDSKEYNTWYHMLTRCLNSEYKNKKPTYKDVTCCDEWLSFWNFCDWLRSQENYNVWKELKWSSIDKDIFRKGNKIYSPENCFLVPVNVNNLFVKHDALRGEHPIGVYYDKDVKKYKSFCTNPFIEKIVTIGSYNTEKEAFESYKEYKEALIKKIADIEYEKGTITEKCKNAMYRYVVEIND